MTASAPRPLDQPSNNKLFGSDDQVSEERGHNAFLAYAAQWRGAIDHALTEGLASQDDPQLVAYLYEPAREFLSSGKRLRPALALLGCEVAGGAPESALAVAAALEYFQAAALIHDDIADHALQRRGRPALHQTQGVGLALNVGDLTLVKSFLMVIEASNLPLAIRAELLEELGAMMVKTVEGQALDLGWAKDKRWNITPLRYLTMAELKTAHYSVASPLVMGARIAGASQRFLETLRQGGLKAGLAFQITDDVLDLTGSIHTLGKAPLGDITEGKRTFMVAWALEHLDTTGRTELIDLLESSVEDAPSKERAVQLLEQSGAIAEATRIARTLAQEAESDFASLEPCDKAAQQALLALPAFTYERTY